jgi:hypothetical protein
MFQNQNRVYYGYMALVEPRDLPRFAWRYLGMSENGVYPEITNSHGEIWENGDQPLEREVP